MFKLKLKPKLKYNSNYKSKYGVALMEVAIALAVFTMITLGITRSFQMIQNYQKQIQAKEVEEDILRSLADYVLKYAAFPAAVGTHLPKDKLLTTQKTSSFLAKNEVKYNLHRLLPTKILQAHSDHPQLASPLNFAWNSLLAPWENAKGTNTFNEIAVSLKLPGRIERQVRFSEFMEKYCFISLPLEMIQDHNSLRYNTTKTGYKQTSNHLMLENKFSVRAVNKTSSVGEFLDEDSS